MTQMLPPPRPGRAAWEEAAAAGRAEGGRPARPARGKRRHLFFPRSFPAAPSETQPAGPAPPPPPPVPSPAPPGGSGCRSRLAGVRFSRGRGAGAEAQRVRFGRESSPPSHGPSHRPLWGRKLGAGEELAQGEKSPRGEWERKRPHPRLPCASSPLGLGDLGAGRGLCPPTAGSEVSPGQGDGPLKNRPFSSSPARWPGRCPPPALHKCKPGRNAEG